jgi:anti-sigma B factor antagonist
VDLGGLTFLDSSGLVALIKARRNAEDAGYRLTVEHPPDTVRRFIEIAGVTELLGWGWPKTPADQRRRRYQQRP